MFAMSLFASTFPQTNADHGDNEAHENKYVDDPHAWILSQ
jgi:hypothetical protein